MINHRAGRLSALREKRGLTVEQLAEAVGVKPSTIKRYERGQGHPNVKVAFDIKEHLGVNWDFLYYHVWNDESVTDNSITFERPRLLLIQGGA